MESSSLFRIVRRLLIVPSPVVLIAALLLAGCGSSNGNSINSIASTVGQLSNSRGLALDSTRNLFIADAGNHDIRVVCQIHRPAHLVAIGTLN